MLNKRKIKSQIPYPSKDSLIHKSRFIVILMLFLPLLTSCWDKTELNELRITTATGIDLLDNGWQISFQTIIPSSIASNSGGGSGASGQPGVHTFAVQAPTMGEARNLSQLELSRKIFLGHNKVIVIGKKAAEDGILPIIDGYLRNTESRETVLMLIAEGTANDLLRKLVPPEKLPGNSYKELLDNESQITSIFAKTSLFDFALKLFSDSSSIGVPVISISGDKTEENDKKLESMDILKETSPLLKVKLTKLAVFKKDRLVGWLNRKESLGLSWLTNKVNQTEVSFTCPDRDKLINAFSITSSSTKLKPVRVDSHFVMTGTIEVGGILENYNCTETLNNTETIENLNRSVEAQILNDIRIAWSKLKQLNADATGFSDQIHLTYPKEWKALQPSWEKEFQNIELQIKVKVNIKHPGLILNTINQPKP
ncbi:Ger(x)C family spore germination protein [Paenibacillus sp. LS1]|uniref:Ger(x)C family spore germination protein n=1 Tax=Paenibacillus sp. LS1 TaxID=2992120 RepID=UPI002232BC89|nr:Ger(x)C family spore germination protein [Paenibacillus sp. LS1]MCW3792674.1 Ger(x)C family spore germination protein [Paenibacillus sp. LS1]